MAALARYQIPGHCEPVLRLVWQSPSLEEHGLKFRVIASQFSFLAWQSPSLEGRGHNDEGDCHASVSTGSE